MVRQCKKRIWQLKNFFIKLRNTNLWPRMKAQDIWQWIAEKTGRVTRIHLQKKALQLLSSQVPALPPSSPPFIPSSVQSWLWLRRHLSLPTSSALVQSEGKPARFYRRWLALPPGTSSSDSSLCNQPNIDLYCLSPFSFIDRPKRRGNEDVWFFLFKRKRQSRLPKHIYPAVLRLPSRRCRLSLKHQCTNAIPTRPSMASCGGSKTAAPKSHKPYRRMVSTSRSRVSRRCWKSCCSFFGALSPQPLAKACWW